MKCHSFNRSLFLPEFRCPCHLWPPRSRRRLLWFPPRWNNPGNDSGKTFKLLYWIYKTTFLTRTIQLFCLISQECFFLFDHMEHLVKLLEFLPARLQSWKWRPCFVRASNVLLSVGEPDERIRLRGRRRQRLRRPPARWRIWCQKYHHQKALEVKTQKLLLGLVFNWYRHFEMQWKNVSVIIENGKIGITKKICLF